MTEQSYNANLQPGMIVDFSYDPKIENLPPAVDWKDDITDDDPTFYWFNQNLKGPFRIHFPSTAHWTYHIQLSDPRDVVLFKLTFKSFEQWTRSYDWNKQPSDPSLDQRTLTVEEFYQGYGYWDYIFYGQAMDKEFLADWLSKNPIPIKPFYDQIDKMKSYEELRKYRLKYGKLEAK